jgi:hypothetical protein
LLHCYTNETETLEKIYCAALPLATTFAWSLATGKKS